MVRLYCAATLKAQEYLELDAPTHHYLTQVHRLATGAEIRVFNEREGEWQAELRIVKRRAHAMVQHILRPAIPLVPVRLVVSPLKPEPMRYLVEKATELGVTDIQPVLFQYTNISKLNLGKLRGYSVEAAQQCERFGPAVIHPVCSLADFVQSFSQDSVLLYCHERTGTHGVVEALRSVQEGIMSLLIGPEGGLSAQDVSLISRVPRAYSVHLGPRILRAETAAVAALSIYQAIKGDWQPEHFLTL